MHDPARVHSKLALINQHGIHPLGASRPGRFTHRNHASDVAKCVIIRSSDSPLRFDVRVEALYLGGAYSSQYVSKTIIVPDLVMNVFEWVILSLGRKVSGPSRPLAVAC